MYESACGCCTAPISAWKSTAVRAQARSSALISPNWCPGCSRWQPEAGPFWLYPHTRVFCKKSLDLLDSEGVDFFENRAAAGAAGRKGCRLNEVRPPWARFFVAVRSVENQSCKTTLKSELLT